MAHFLRRRLGPIDDARPGHVAMLLENHLELLALYGGCGYAGSTLFGVNTGLRGETLRRRAQPVARARPGRRPAALAEVERVRGQLHARRAREHPRAAHRPGALLAEPTSRRALAREVGPAGRGRSTRPASTSTR